jgi:hypothetical protein
LLALGGLVALLAVAVPVAWASHQFTDVPNGHQFHTEITAIRDAGITGGKTCVPPGTPPTYCPDEPVTRGAMAAFMNRGFTRGGTAFFGNAPLTGAFATIPNTLTINAGGVPGGTGFLEINVNAGVFAFADEATCPCQAQFRILVDGADTSTNSWAQFDSFGGAGYGIDHSPLTAVVPVSTGAPHTVALQGVRVTGGTGVLTAFGQISATYFPFGRTGGSTLSTPGQMGGPTAGK